MSDISSIQGWMSEMQSTMADLGSQVQQAAPTGDFEAVFSAAQSVMSGQPTLSTTPSASAAPSSGTPSTSTSASGTYESGTGSGVATSALATSLPAHAIPTAATAGVASSTNGATVVATAEKYLGVPYVWGGTTPAGFDCSGFTRYVFDQLGISLPRTSEEQASSGSPVPSVAAARPGDLVFYAGSDGTSSSPGHVGIYIGNGKMINAPESGENVSITSVGDPVAIRRLVSSGSMSAVAAAAAAKIASAPTATGSATTVLTDAPSSMQTVTAPTAATVATAVTGTTAATVATAATAETAAIAATAAAATTGTAATTTAAAAAAAGAAGAPLAAATSPATATGTAGITSVAPAVSMVPGASVTVPSAYASTFSAAASRYGVPVTLLAAVAQVESNFTPDAVSSKGAEGLMQIMPATAAGLGIDPYDPTQAINGAAQLLSGYLAQYHSTATALAAYNAGPAAVAEFGGVPPYPETQAYVQNVMQLAGVAS